METIAAQADCATRDDFELADVRRAFERHTGPVRDSSGELIGRIIVVREITAELEAERLKAEISSERDAARLKSELVATVSHELRTPLTSVLANLELLAEELDGDQAETAQAALRSTRRMRRLVGDLLLLARADARRGQPRRRTDLADVLTEVAAELGPVTDDHELSINAEPAVVYGVRDDLHRLALNLIENAVRHTPPGTRIWASTSTDNGDAKLVVQDDGPGIPAELHDHLFERFIRGGRDGGRGSGLGLAIVRAVAESHGGTVALERPTTSTGRGTRFVIRIPAWGQTPANGAAAESEQQPAGQTSTTTGSTIGRRRNRS
jgi:signal transduction histidine kinase